MKNVLFAAVAIAVLTLAVWMQIEVWNECRETHSFWYCMRTLNK